MNRKILFFMSGTYVSGLEIVTLHLLKGLKEKEYEVECIINGWNDGNLKSKLENLKIPCHEIKLGWLHLRKPLWTIDTLIHYPQAYLTCKKIINDFKPDILNFTNYYMPVMIYRLIRHKSVFNLQETHLASKKHRWMYNLLNKKINVFTAVSKHIFKVLEQLNIPSSKIRIIYNGIPPVKQLEPDKNIVVNKSNLSFAIVGQVAEWKGHSTIVSAAEILVNKDVKNFTIQIFGNDANAFASKLKDIIHTKRLDSYFTWKGYLKNQDEIYNDCDIVLVPSLSEEPCSLTIIEAMTRGKAVIVSDRGGNPELVTHELNGLVFQADDMVKLSESMHRLINDHTMINTLGINARNFALSNFNYESMTDAYIKIYQQL